jgi:hypothetical protein
VTAVGQLRGQLASRKKAPAPPPWRRPEAADFQEWQPVMAYDATLSHTGWVSMTVARGEVCVFAKGIINPSTELTGYLGTWAKAAQLRDELAEVRRLHCVGTHHEVVEAPSVGGGSRTESSLIAGMLVALDARGSVAAISATHVSAVMLGDARIRSAQRKVAVRDYLAWLVPETTGRDWNEHERDALITGLTHLYDMKRRQTGAQT